LKRNKISLFLIILFFQSVLSFSQSSTTGILKGLITDKESGNPLIGANIYLKKDLTRGTTSLVDGTYRLELEPGNYIIVFSFTGMKSENREVKIVAGGETIINLNMLPFSHDFDEITISAGKYDRKPEELMVSTERISKAVIEAKNTITIETILDQIPGVNILDEEPQIRGGSGFTFGVGSKVAVILDGMPMINASAGKPDWGLVPVENLKQVEVVKGPGSVLTGASAMSGAIFFQNEYVGNNPRTKVRLYGGMYLPPKDPSQKWWTGVNYISGLSFLTAQYLDSAKSLEMIASGMANFEKGYQGAPKPGKYAIGNNNVTDADIKNHSTRINFNIKKRSLKTRGLNYGINASLMLEQSPMILAWFDDTVGFYRGYPGASLLQEKVFYYLDPYISLVTQSGSSHELKFRLMGDQNELSNDQFTNTTALFGKYEYSKYFKNITNLNLIGGISGQGTYSNSNIYEGSGSSKNKVTNVSVYLEVEKKILEAVTFLIGFRGEYYDLNKVDNYIIPLLRSSLNFKLMQETYLRVSYGQGARFPTIAERYIRTNLGAFGVFDNPDLVPESGWNAEIGLKQGFKFSKFYGYLDIAGFLQEYENTVEYLFGFWDPTYQFAIAGFKFVNTGKSRVTGIDVSLTGEAKWSKNQSITILGGYTFILPVTLEPDLVFAEDYNPGQNNEFSYNSTSVNPENKILKYRFQHTFKLDVEYKISRFAIGISSRYYSKMVNVDKAIFDFEDATSQIGGTFPPILYKNYYYNHNNGNLVFDARVAYQINAKNKISLISNNITNRRYSLRPLKAEAMQSITLQYLGSF
jgi:iron complex outermembrane receptor protein